MTIEAMKQALEALELYQSKSSVQMFDVAAKGLRAAIEQAQDTHDDWCASLTQLLMSMPPKPAPCNCKLKTAQRDSRQWQWLTHKEIVQAKNLSVNGDQVFLYSFARAIEAKLKEKNNA